jgi:hypothetical protein
MKHLRISVMACIGAIVLAAGHVGCAYAQSHADTQQPQIQEEFRSLRSQTGEAYLQAVRRCSLWDKSVSLCWNK